MMFENIWEIGDLDAARPGQKLVLDEFEGRLNAWIGRGFSGSFVFSIMLPCRYGKSDVMRSMAVKAMAMGIASCALVIHPFPDLSSQFMDAGRYKAWRKRWLPTLGSDKVKEIKSFGEEVMQNGEWLGSVHIQALMPEARKRYARLWVDSVKNANNGRPPIIFVDETQSYTNNDWGFVPKMFEALGCPIVVCTATPFRSDGDDVYGFKKVLKNQSIETNFVFRQNPEDEATRIKTTYTKDVTEFDIEADVSVPFSSAWDEGVIAKVTMMPVDFKCIGAEANEGEEKNLSELPESEAKKVLKQLVRDDEFISDVVSKMIARLDEFRRAGVEKPAAIIFGANDHDGFGVNSHQEKIKAEISRQSNLESIIATMSVDGSSTKIADFCCPAKKKGDVLLLKQMGTSGLDIDRCCVVVLLGTGRSLGQLIQQIMRGGNVFGPKRHFVVIYPDDKIIQNGLAAWINDQGGVFRTESIITTNDEVVPKGTDNEKGYFVPLEKIDSGASDHTGATCSFDDVLLVRFLLTKFPELVNGHSFPQLAKEARDLGMKLPESFLADNCEMIETTKLCDGLREQLGSAVTLLSKLLYLKRFGIQFSGAEKENISKLGELKALAASLIKKRSGNSKTWNSADPKRSENPDDYRKWISAANEIIAEYQV